MNRRGEVGDQLYLAYFIFILLMITGGIVLGSYLTSGKDYDIRAVDASTLASTIARCLAQTPVLTSEKIADIYSLCNLNKQVFEQGLILEINTQQKDLFHYGDLVACGLSDKNEQYPRCSQTSVHVALDTVPTDVYILAGSKLQSVKHNG